MKFIDYIQLSVAIFMIIICLIMYLSENESGYCKNNRFNLKKKFSGVVVSMERDIWEHSDEELTLSNGFSFVWDNNLYDINLYDKISIGDSVIKRKGELTFKIVKPDTIIYLNLYLPCD